ncbi:tetratricopeptide repeat protein [bacterium]|nr:tetratricopeptide repeat protein [bacterium]MBP9809116.1 tetratricopeptide repeat protein [bacterium]
MKSESIDKLEQFLKLQENMHGPDSRQVAKVLIRLAIAFMEDGRLSDAEENLLRALSIEQSRPAPDQKLIVEVGKQIDRIHQKLGAPLEDDLESLKVSTDRIPALTPMFEPTQSFPQSGGVLDAFASATSPDSDTSTGTNSAATADAAAHSHTKTEPIDKAIVAAQQQIRQIKQAGGSDSVAVADALTKLADLYCRKEQLSEMEPLLVEALRIRESICGSAHLSVSTELKNLGRLYYFKKRYDLAEPYLRRALSIREATLGQFHSYVADVAEWLAKVYRKTARVEEAKEMEALVLESRTNYGSDWEKFRVGGVRALALGNVLEAQAMWLGALDESSEFRFDDPRLSTTLEGLAEVYWRRGKFDKAEPLCKQILQISETLLGQEHTDVALAANNLALLCDRQGKYSEAAMLYQQALAISEKILGRNHPDVVGILECHAKARQMAQKQIERKLERA